ncbi:MAG TPA: hypothetical protein VIF14_12825 [Alphaproteobacteria bacterium]|jgi:hypothetical protein
MAIFRLLTLGFGAGAFGACILALVSALLNALHVQELIGLPPPPTPDSYLPLFYRLVVWGGIWGLLLVVPVMNRLWWLKGIIIGVLATLAILFYFNPGVTTPPMRLAYVFVLNTVWGLAAGGWWAFVANTRKNGRKYGTFMR